MTRINFDYTQRIYFVLFKLKDSKRLKKKPLKSGNFMYPYKHINFVSFIIIDKYFNKMLITHNSCHNVPCFELTLILSQSITCINRHIFTYFDYKVMNPYIGTLNIN